MNEEHRSSREGISEGIRQGLGVLSAFKEALEETIAEARERGDLNSDRAREIMEDALDRAQSAAEDARERLDFVSRKEMDSLRSELAELRRRVADLESRSGPDGGKEESGPTS